MGVFLTFPHKLQLNPLAGWMASQHSEQVFHGYIAHRHNVEALCKLLGGAAVEGDRRDRRRVNVGRNEPRDPRDEGSGLAAARRSDAQHRTGRRRGCGALVGSQPGEPLGNGRVRHGSRR